MLLNYTNSAASGEPQGCFSTAPIPEVRAVPDSGPSGPAELGPLLRKAVGYLS